MSQHLQLRRVWALLVLLALAFAGMGYRLVDLQVLRHDDLLAKAEQNTQREFTLVPRRGDILDVHGNLLATSVFVKTVCADPTLIGNHQVEVAHAIAPILQLDEVALRQALTPKFRVNEKGETNALRYVRLKSKVSMETWQRVQAAMTNLTFAVDEKKLPKADQAFLRDLRTSAIGVDPVDDQLRVYPNQSLASHILGFVGMNEGEVNSNRFQQTVGKEGIELSFNTQLTGTTGWRVTETDKHQRELVSLRGQDVQPRDGLNVVLTIDSAIQHTLESALADAMVKFTPVSACGIVIRPRTGEILAMATMPNFDPNNPGAATPDSRRNRVITDIVEPGSTFKIVVVSGALNENNVTLNDVFYCEHGHFAFAGKTLHDHEALDNETVEGIITKSSNIGAAKIGIKMGPEELYDYIHNFGFGVRTGIPLPSEARGVVYPIKDWSKVSIAQIPMGQGVAVTRLQMAFAMAAIANDGVLMRPMLISRLEDRDGNIVAQYPPQQVRRVISDETAKKMVMALKTVVTPDGTAYKASLTNINITAAGKTGTAQKAEHGVYVPGKYISSFIGFFPADDPDVCISIVLDEPKNGYYGGLTAGPVFKEVAERTANYLNVQPDLNQGPSTGIAQGNNSEPAKIYARTIPQTKKP
ncbi:MAG TPA: penicillin-binding protein 2 [Verrucomicrobiae bacterium]|nr:penicillin-binding protein 2 [Verrucomicrobiae bacterium]